MKRTLSTLVFFIAASLNLFSQEIVNKPIPKDSLMSLQAAEDEYKKYIPTFAPLTPNAAALQKYGDYQVNLATGIPDIKILLGSAKSGELESPIYLRYHPSGFKIDDLASWVGWGWSLDYGPSLTRAVKGQADDKDGATGNNYLNVPLIPRDFCASYADFDFGRQVLASQADIKPDLFSYSTFNNSGKFHLGQGSSPNFLIPFQPVQITKHVFASDNQNASGKISHFNVVDQKGIEYVFGRRDNGSYVNETFSMVSGSTTQIYTNNWQITEIKAPNANDKLSYEYQAAGAQFLSSLSYSATMYYNRVPNCAPFEPMVCAQAYPESSNVVPIETNTQSTVSQNNIHKINHQNGYIEFEQSTAAERLDLPNSRYLKNIKFYNLADGAYHLMRTITFQYGYFEGVNEKRLQLQSIITTGNDGTSPETHTFDYFTNTFSWNSTDAVRLKQDYFGYYNGFPNTHLIPVASYNGIAINNGAANRNSVADYAKEGVLQKITYPSGGYSEFDFENNKYDANGIIKLAGGLRVKSIKNTAGFSTQPTLKRYTYGLENATDIGRFTTNWFPESAQVPKLTELLHLQIAVGGSSRATQAIFTQNGFIDADSHDQAPIYYTHIKEYFEEATATIKNGYNAYVFDFFMDLQIESQGYSSRNVKPWLRGNLLSKHTYNTSNNLVESTINSYFSTDPKAAEASLGAAIVSPHTIDGFGSSDGILIACSGNPEFYSNWPIMVYWPLNYQTGSNPIEKTTIWRDGVTEEQSFSYDQNLMRIQTTSLDSYTNHTYSQTTKYPTHSSYNSDAIALEMRSRNMIAEPLETEEVENLDGTINTISKQRNVYAEYAGTNARGLTNNILQSQIQIAPNGNSLETRVQFTEYDTDGNPLEYKVDGVPTSLLWGYGGNAVVALIKNATKAEVDAAKTTANIDLADFNVTNLSATLLAKVTAFQNALPNAQTSWYTNIPHVGIAEMIAINGLKTSFEYDAMQRLKLSKDHEGNLLAFNQYNFGLNPSITSSVFRVPTTNTADANNTNKANISISYFDGLGRDLQKVGKQQSPTQYDIVSNSLEYDAYGRAFKTYLTAPATVGTGVYQSDPQALGSTFYDDSRPFSQVIAYDNSPLNREKETMGTGQDWKNTDPNLDKKVKHFYETNGANDVRYYYLDASNNIKKSGYYPTNSLYKKRKLDEENHETISYTDKRGRQILTQQEDETGYISTYYLYDGAGRTRAVIQPEGYQLDANIDYNTDNWNRWVFEYQYDARGRQIEKKVPGAAKEYFVYDKWDRLIMSQDGYQAEKGFWKFNKYDALDRNIYAGIKTDGNTRSTHQTNANNTAGRYETKNGTAPYYSLGTTYPSVSASDIWLANYFDDYTNFRTTDSLNFLAGQTESILYANTRGQLTGAYERSSIDNAWLKSANYYDSKNRLIQSRKIHQLSKNATEVNSKADANSIEYNFAGNVVKQIGIIKKAATNNLPFSNQNNVDLLGRITGNFHTVNTLQQNIATYIYDEINRIKTKNIGLGGVANSQANGNWNEPSVWNGYQIPNLNNAVTIDHNINVPANYKGYSGVLTLGGSINFDAGATIQLAPTTSNTLLQKIDIQHHIRGGLLGVNLDTGEPSVANDGDLFSLKLNHGYDGNITAQAWKDKANNQDRAWAYAYDPSSRIKSATYTPSGTYNVSGITYDKNGNIKTLNRAGVDALTYDYTNSGNTLLKVTDGTTGNTNVGDFRNGTNSGNDYEYYTDGSLKLDRNKTIKTIEYDPFHKKVKYVEFDDGKWNKFDYAGNGSLIKRQNSTGEYWDYTANIIYKNGVAYQMNTAEGRTVYNGTAWEYEFEYRDHNEDLRLSFKNENGLPTIVQQNTNDIWGWEIKGLSNVETGNSTQSNFRFLDRESVFETGWVNLNNRMVDPQLGRFISQDKITAEQENYSLYQYGWNNPVLRSDPTGNWPGEGLWNKIKEGVKSASAWAGSVFTESSNLRKTYQAESAKLTEKTPENNLKRLELKANVRDATPQPIKAMLDKNRPMSGETAKVKAGAVNNPSKTNSSVNSLAEKFGTAGKVVTGVGVAISATNIATSANPMNQVGIEAGGWAGAYTGGVLAAEAAAPSGNPYVIGASGLVGSIVGGVFGQEAVKQVQSIPRVPLFTLLPR